MMQRLQLNNEDRLALLCGYAYSHNLTLDLIARLVTTRLSNERNSWHDGRAALNT